MFCTQCGSRVEEGTRFCTSCGSPLGPGSTPSGSSVSQASRASVPPTPQAPLRADAARRASSQRSAFPPAAVTALVLVLVLAVASAAGVATDWFGLAVTRGDMDAATGGATGEVGREAEGDGPTSGEMAEEKADPADDVPQVRAATADYSWEELSQISRLISSAGSDAEGIEVARRYHLCTEDGRLDGTQTKSLTLSDGMTVTMQVAGFNHDQRADGSGPAGITLVSRGTVASRAMNEGDETAGGWRDSDLRAWMNGELASLLPHEVSSVIAVVNKPTNVVGETADASSVVMTQDTLWTLSYSEIGGHMSTDDSAHDAVFNAEGEQYKLFSDLGTSWDAGNQHLQIAGVEYWWERSPDPLDGRYFMCVGPDGTPWYARVPSEVQGVVMCFCV